MKIRFMLSCLLLIIAAQAPAFGARPTFQTIYSFCTGGPCPGGSYPFGVAVGPDGYPYGITLNGGNSGSSCHPNYGSGRGVVFELVPDNTGSWTETALYSFCTQPDCEDGSQPSSLIIDQYGDIYGTTAFGGDNGSGVVFKLTKQSGKKNGWVESAIYSFSSQCAFNAYGPQLAVSSSGVVFGIVDSSCSRGGGTLFQLTPVGTNWAYTVLHEFCQTGKCARSAAPADLTMDATGRLYVETTGGGTESCGAVFEFTPDAHGRLVYRFQPSDGCYPSGGLAIGPDGKQFYGTTTGAGQSTVSGAVFALTRGGVLTLLASLPSWVPWYGVTLDPKGDLYGAAPGVTHCNCISLCCQSTDPSIAYKVRTKDGRRTIINKDIALPTSRLSADSSGNLFGVTDDSAFEIIP